MDGGLSSSMGDTSTSTGTSGATDATSGPGETSSGSSQAGTDATSATGTTSAGATDGTSTTSTSTTGTTSTTSTSGAPEGCGNGVQEPGESCDDGNDVNGDGCDNDCFPTSCHDGVLNNEESDVDCGGGACQGCFGCGQCSSDTDCLWSSCIDGICLQVFEVVVDWKTHCGGSGTQVSVTQNSPLVITPLGGGGRLDQKSPDNYGWIAECDNIDFGPIKADFAYPSPDAAFATIQGKSWVSDYPQGGFTECRVPDDTCDDNEGTSYFELRTACD